MNGFAVRPVLHLDLSSPNVWSYAGTVSSDGIVDEVQIGKLKREDFLYAFMHWNATSNATGNEFGYRSVKPFGNLEAGEYVQYKIPGVVKVTKDVGRIPLKRYYSVLGENHKVKNSMRHKICGEEVVLV